MRSAVQSPPLDEKKEEARTKLKTGGCRDWRMKERKGRDHQTRASRSIVVPTGGRDMRWLAVQTDI